MLVPKYLGLNLKKMVKKVQVKMICVKSFLAKKQDFGEKIFWSEKYLVKKDFQSEKIFKFK